MYRSCAQGAAGPLHSTGPHICRPCRQRAGHGPSCIVHHAHGPALQEIGKTLLPSLPYFLPSTTMLRSSWDPGRQGEPLEGHLPCKARLLSGDTLYPGPLHSSSPAHAGGDPVSAAWRDAEGEAGVCSNLCT